MLFHEEIFFWSTSLNNMIRLSVFNSWIFTRLSYLQEFQIALQGHGEGEGERWMMGKKKGSVSLNWLGEVIEERLPQSMQKSLIFLCSLVWQLNRLKMTLSISQARIGDTYKLTIADTQGFRSPMHMHARPSFAMRNFANAIFDSGNSPSSSAPE